MNKRGNCSDLQLLLMHYIQVFRIALSNCQSFLRSVQLQLCRRPRKVYSQCKRMVRKMWTISRIMVLTKITFYYVSTCNVIIIGINFTVFMCFIVIKQKSMHKNSTDMIQCITDKNL